MLRVPGYSCTTDLQRWHQHRFRAAAKSWWELEGGICAVKKKGCHRWERFKAMLMLLEGDLLPRYSPEYQAPVAQCPWSVPGCSGQQGRGFGQVPPAPTSSLRGWLLWAEPLCFDTELSGWRDGLGMTHCPTRCAHWCRLPAAPPPPDHAVELSARLSPLSKPTGEPHLEGGWHGGARAMCLQMAVLQPSGSWEILFFILFYFLFFFSGFPI